MTYAELKSLEEYAADNGLNIPDSFDSSLCGSDECGCMDERKAELKVMQPQVEEKR